MLCCFLGVKKSLPDSLSVVELSVRMDCEGCKKRVRKAIMKLDGVDTVDIDVDNQKVTVAGYVDLRRVLKAVRRTGRKAEFWQHPYDVGDYPFALQHLEDAAYSSNYNHYQHGYTSNVHGYMRDAAYSSTVDDNVIALFNDENVHACTIM